LLHTQLRDRLHRDFDAGIVEFFRKNGALSSGS
jgi:hypothetical protein